MNKQNISKGTFKVAQSFVTGASAIAGALLIVSGSIAATLSGESFKQYGAEEAYWVISVSCEDGSAARVIQRKTDGNEWCGKDADGFCAADKASAADKVCSAEYSGILNERKQAQAAKIAKEREEKAREQARQQAARDAREKAARETAARQRAAEASRQSKIKIDEDLLQIEQEKLSLRRQELELQRRAVEIREALEGLDS